MITITRRDAVLLSVAAICVPVEPTFGEAVAIPSPLCIVCGTALPSRNRLRERYPAAGDYPEDHTCLRCLAEEMRRADAAELQATPLDDIPA